ncbi:MAG: radical SAM protein [Candidatus Omnitrophota bacterium]
MIKKFKVAAGIFTRKVFTGPLEVSIDVTNRCSLGCLTCWFYSPLQAEKVSNEWVKKEIDFELFKKVVDELKDMKVKNIMLGGNGDPFMHPRIIDMIEYTKKRGFIVNTSTCGVYFKERELRNMLDLGIDSINVSILAATQETYLNMHNDKKRELFDKVKKNISLISEWKKKEKKRLPCIRLVNVICNLNYFEIDKMVNLAKEIGADEVGFKRLAIMPFTKKLLLTGDQIKELAEILDIADKKADLLRIATNINDFRQNIMPGLISGDYTSDIYSRMPCYIGWIYSRILCDGNVVPCCGCCSYIIGNLHNNTFKEIWNSEIYREFRKKTIEIVENPSIKAECACHTCVHVGSNRGIYRRMNFWKKV